MKKIQKINEIEPNIYADEELLAKNWLTEEDNTAWKDL